MSQIKPFILVENTLATFERLSSNVHHAIAYQLVTSIITWTFSEAATVEAALAFMRPGEYVTYCKKNSIK